MKPVFKCDYCDKMSDEETIRKHEEKCYYNPKNRMCFSCTFGEIYPFGVCCRKNPDKKEPSPRECSCSNYVTGTPIRIVGM